MESITLQPLTAEAFQPFGEVLLANDRAQHYNINNNRCVRYHHLATADAGNGQVITSLFRGKHAPLPFVLEVMERHPLGSQIFLPMTTRPYAIVVANTLHAPDKKDLVAFIARPSNNILVGINYHKNIWHHPLIALRDAADTSLPADTSDFWVIDRLGAGNNLEEVDISPWQIYIDKI